MIFKSNWDLMQATKENDAYINALEAIYLAEQVQDELKAKGVRSEVLEKQISDWQEVVNKLKRDC